jgi:hypothetical protein
MRESADAELMQRLKCGSVLKWYPSRQKCENGKSLEALLTLDYVHTFLKIIINNKSLCSQLHSFQSNSLCLCWRDRILN